jgi:hypothetical protein
VVMQVTGRVRWTDKFRPATEPITHLS